MATETFRHIEYSDKDSFINKEGKIELVKFAKDLIFYASFDSTPRATYHKGEREITSSGSASIENWGVFGQHLLLENGSIKYNKNNFDDLGERGSIHFRLKPNFASAYGYQEFLSKEETFSLYGIGFEEGYYGFSINQGVGGSSQHKDVIIFLEEIDTLVDISNKIHNKLTGSFASVGIVGGRIRVSSKERGRDVSISPITQSGVVDILPILGGTGESFLLNPPVPNGEQKIFDFFNGVNNKNRIYLSHDNSSHLHLVMFDNNENKKVDKDLGAWNNSKYSWYSFEIGWNRSVAEVFIDGKLIDTVKTGFVRAGGTDLILSAAENSPYGFDELIIYDKQINREEYIVKDYALTPFTTSTPYIDIFFGSGFLAHEIVGLNLNCSSNVHFVVQAGEQWFYYYAGGWQTSDGSFSQSSLPSLIETKFIDLSFEEEMDITIRAYFHSDGYSPVWLDEVSIITEESEAQPASITGTTSLLEAVDLSSNYNVVITTGKESKEVDLSASAVDTSNVSMKEIKKAINDAKISGLALATDDGRGHLVLKTKDAGVDAIINISEGTEADALELVWGYEDSDIGSQSEEPQFFDYSEIYRWIRSQLGAPQAPVELTDEQLQDCVSPAVYWYNYYRNAKENIIYASLTGNVRDGWEIPKEVAGEDNIIEIVMKPRFPYTFYTGRTDIIGQVYMQWFFQQNKRDLRHMAGDYYLTMSTQQDLNNIMGSGVKWHFYNGRLFLHPEPPVGMDIGIRFRSAVSVNEINTNIFIRDYALGRAKTVLGTIRATFGGTIPGGSEMLTLRGEAMISEGKEEMEAVIRRMQNLSEPLGFDWG